MAMRYFIVDAFTAEPFSGNPAAVVLPKTWPNDAWMQQLAREFNLSETAFAVPAASGYELRWFTPKVEVALCGHATLATAKALADIGRMDTEVSFSTKSGILKVRRRGDQFDMDFPVKVEESCKAPEGLLEALHVHSRYVGRNAFDYLVEVEREIVVRELQPDFRQLAKVECRGVIVTAASDLPDADFVSRFFAPGAGVDEDPVTGSAHCCLVDFWGKRLGKSKMTGRQVSERGGMVRVERIADRALLGGQAAIVAQGELRIGT